MRRFCLRVRRRVSLAFPMQYSELTDTAMRTIAILILSAALTASCMSQQVAKSTGKISGSVILIDSKGDKVDVPRATVKLIGPSQSKAMSDGRGSYSFEELPIGLY